MVRYALIVGINHYKEEYISKLKYAQQDGIKIHNFLSSIGYESTSLYGSEADFKTINSTLHSVRKKIKPGDTFVFFFSGHVFETESEQYLLPYDALPWITEKGENGNSLSISQIEEISCIKEVGPT